MKLEKRATFSPATLQRTVSAAPFFPSEAGRQPFFHSAKTVQPFFSPTPNAKSPGTGTPPQIQMSRLRDFAGAANRHAFLIGDSEIETTNEFKSYMNPGLVWQWKDRMTKPEALLACRLMVEALQRNESIHWDTDARVYMNSARKLIGITKAPRKDCPDPKYKACVKRAVLPGALRNLTASPGLLIGFFKMEIDWHENEPDCACCCGEYRQFVRGFVKVDGRTIQKKLFNGALLSPTDWHEDGDKNNYAYGHRDFAEDTNDKFIPDRPNGCLYRGFDNPGIPDTAVGGKHVEISLEFKGQTFDRCQNAFGPENLWNMNFNDDVPGTDEGGGVIT